jgi:HK97 family phage major capsid protein
LKEVSGEVVPEGEVKPPLSITFSEATSRVATIANYVKISRQSLLDVPLMSTWLNIRLSYSVNLKEEDVLINGDTTNNIQGLMQLATPFAYTPLATDQQMDVIAHSIGALMGKGYSPDGVILNAADYTSMRLLKTTIGSYIFMGDGCTMGPDDEPLWEQTPLIWQVPMVVSPSMPQGQFIVADFQQCAILFSRETLTVEIAFQNEDDFIRNLVCLRGELRSGLAVPVPAGVLKGTLPSTSAAQANQPAAPAAPVKK